MQGLSKVVTNVIRGVSTVPSLSTREGEDEGDRLAPVQRPLTPVSSTGQALTLSRKGERELWKGPGRLVEDGGKREFLSFGLHSTACYHPDKREVSGGPGILGAAAQDSHPANGISLIEGERVDSTISLDGMRGKDRSATLVLTDRRLIHIGAAGLDRTSSFVSIADVTSVEVTNTRRRSLTGLAWAAAALLIAAIVWSIWDHAIFSPLAAVVLAGMGIYLAVDRLWGYDSVRATFRSAQEQIGISIEDAGGEASAQIHTLATRLFELKDGAGPGIRKFAPR